MKHDVSLNTRVVDYGGLFHDDVRPGHQFGQQDHRAFRPAGWVEAGVAKLDRLRDIARKHNLTMLQLACLWNLSQPGVKSVIPTIIQESGAGARPMESKIDELAALPDLKLSDDECGLIAKVGANQGCLDLKGANRAHIGEPQPDRWGLLRDHEQAAKRWNIDPDTDLACTHKPAA